MLVPKNHTFLELNASAFNHNIQLYKNIIGSQSILSVVLKSNAYGHGMKEVAQLCEKNPLVDWLCVAMLSEALELRLQGITKPILVLSIIDENPAFAALHNIDLPAFDDATILKLHEAGKQIGKKIAIHLKIDSGMARFGLSSEKALHSIKLAHELSGINLRGIFSHCVESGNPDQTYTRYQLEQFVVVLKQLDALGIQIPLRHAANSAAASTLHQEFPALNFIRLGAGAYGLWHFRDTHDKHPNLDLKPVLSWKSCVTHIKEVPAGTFVGYDRTHQTSRLTLIATIPIGYYEGYDRRFSNQGIVRIRDYYAHVVGRICMNAMLIAIPEGKEVAYGDQVILLGDYDQLRAHDLAAMIGSFNAREITTRLNPAMERRIVEKEIEAEDYSGRKVAENQYAK